MLVGARGLRECPSSSMVTDAAFCTSGDHTLAASISAVEDVTQELGVGYTLIEHIMGNYVIDSTRHCSAGRLLCVLSV